MAVPSRVQASEERGRCRRHPLRARHHRSPPSAGLGPGSSQEAVNRVRPTTPPALWDHGSTARRWPPPQSPPPPSPGSRTPDRWLRRPRAPHSPHPQAPPPPPAAGHARDRRPRPPPARTRPPCHHRPGHQLCTGPTTPAPTGTALAPHLGSTTIARHLGHGSIRRPYSGAAATTRPDQAADGSPRAVVQRCRHSGPTAAARPAGGAPRPHPYRYCLPSCARPGPLMPRAWVVAGLTRRISAATATTARAMPAGIATLSAWRRL